MPGRSAAGGTSARRERRSCAAFARGRAKEEAAKEEAKRRVSLACALMQGAQCIARAGRGSTNARQSLDGQEVNHFVSHRLPCTHPYIPPVHDEFGEQGEKARGHRAGVLRRRRASLRRNGPAEMEDGTRRGEAAHNAAEEGALVGGLLLL